MQVTAKDGFFCTIRLAAVLPLTPSETFELLARPDSHNIFRSITVRDCSALLSIFLRPKGGKAGDDGACAS